MAATVCGLQQLSLSDWTRYRALLAKHGRREEEFRLSEEHLRRSADGTPEGSVWVIQVRTGRGVTFHVDKFRSNWLEVFDSYLQQEIFPRES